MSATEVDRMIEDYVEDYFAEEAQRVLDENAPSSFVDRHGRDLTPGPWADDSGRDWLA